MSKNILTYLAKGFAENDVMIDFILRNIDYMAHIDDGSYVCFLVKEDDFLSHDSNDIKTTQFLNNRKIAKFFYKNNYYTHKGLMSEDFHNYCISKVKY